MEPDTPAVGSAETRITRRDVRGVDAAHDKRPGVPMEAEPRPDAGASWDEPERQIARGRHFKRAGLARLTPVYGTAQPPKGVSGVMRQAAYDIPEHKASHWTLLMAADRVDVLESKLGRLTGDAGSLPIGRHVRTRPLLALAVAGLAGVMVARAVR